jgi:hypothetical protein
MISKEKLESYFAVLSIMEANLAEYSKIAEDLKAIHGDVTALNNTIVLEKQQKMESLSKPPEMGDALSRLLNAKRKSIMMMPTY